MTERRDIIGVNSGLEADSLAHEGLRRIENAILELLHRNPQGLRNAQIAEILGIRSIVRGGQRDYLTYSVLGGLLAQGRITWDTATKLYAGLDADNIVQSEAEKGLRQIEEAIL